MYLLYKRRKCPTPPCLARSVTIIDTKIGSAIYPVTYTQEITATGKEASSSVLFLKDLLLFYFEDLRALRDQHHWADRHANRIKCFKEKHSRTSASIQQLVDEGSVTEDRTKVVTSEIQKLEEQLSVLKAEQMTLSSKLHQ